MKINPKKFSQLLANEITRMKLAKEFRINDLCEAIDMSRTTLYRLENGVTEHFVKVLQLCNYLNIDLSKLMKESEEE